MDFYTLIQKIEKHSPVLYGVKDQNYDLQTIRLLTKDQSDFHSSCLYISSTDLLPDKTMPYHFALFCYGPDVDFTGFENSSFTVIYMGENITFQELFNLLEEQVTEVQQITAGMHLLVNGLFAGQGLQHLTDVAATVFGNPVYVVDLQHKYLAISSTISRPNNFWIMEQQSGYISDEGLRLIRENRLDEKVRNNRAPYLFYNSQLDQQMLIDSIRIQGIEIGHVMIQESEHPFSEFDAELLHRFSRLLSIELQKDSVFTNNKGVMYSYFLADLLKNPHENTAAVEKRITAMGYKLKGDLSILVVPSASRHTADIRTEVMVSQLRSIFPGSLYVIYEDSVVFLISREKHQGFSEYELKRLTDFLSANRLKAGISNFFEELEHAARFYRQAQKAIKLGIRFNDPSPICRYNDYYIFEILETYEKTDPEIRYMIHPGLIKLYDYDQEKGTELIQTLRIFLEYPGQPAKVADRLHIHKNTLLYRMGKIRELTNCTFETGSDYIRFGLSFKIMEYLKMIES